MSSSSTPETTTQKSGGRAQAAKTGRPRWEVADVVRWYGDEFRARYRPLPEQRRVLWAIENCQSEGLGGHWMHCEGCARDHVAYNSCLMGSLSLWRVRPVKGWCTGRVNAVWSRVDSP